MAASVGAPSVPDKHKDILSSNNTCGASIGLKSWPPSPSTLDLGDAAAQSMKDNQPPVLSPPTMLQKLVAEFVGTFVLVFCGCGSVLVSKIYVGNIGIGGIALTWGAAVMIIIYSMGHVSGAHLNPAVTFAFAIIGHFRWLEVPSYILVQCIGSTFANLVLKLVFDRKGEIMHWVVTQPGLQGDNLQSFTIEVIITAILMFAVCGTATDSRAIGDLAGIVIGITVAMDVFLAGLVSGASLNPARSLGSAIVANVYRALYVYMFGPTLGAVIGALVYSIIRPSPASSDLSPVKRIKSMCRHV